MFSAPESCFLQSRQRFYKRQHSGFEEELQDLFNKKFQFRCHSDWKLPSESSCFAKPPWVVKELSILKSRLNFHKSQLNDFNIEEWSSHTRRRNPAGEVCWKIRCLVNPEFLTQAWTKFYECASTYNVVPLGAIIESKIVSLHLCEAPGAFITSLNHFLKTNHPNIEWKWVANTLNPYYEGNSSSNMISDDRFMFHTLDYWNFGVDSTGNLMDWDNSQGIIEAAKSLGKVMLITADGSIDCLQKPDAQEEVTSPLHYCEIVTALQALSPGGTLIFKLFTMFEHSTVCLLYLLNNLFKEVNIYKPVTSRQGNSEVYAICLEYKSSQLIEQYIPRLKSAYGTDLYGNMALFPLEEIPEYFLKQIEECACYFGSIQSQVINDNLQAYLMQNNIAFHVDIKKIRALVASEFIQYYNLKPLELEQEILKGILHEENKINTNPRYHRGSYTERQLYSKMTLKEKSHSLTTSLQADILSNPLIFINDPVKWKSFYNIDLKGPLHFTYGQPVLKINSSKFIFVPIFKLYQQILAEDEFQEIILQNKSLKTEATNSSDCKNILALPEYDFKETYYLYEKKCFKMVIESLRALSIGETILLTNFFTLSHFNVSLLYILSNGCFEKTGFTSDSIILSNLMNKTAFKYMDAIEEECCKLENDCKRDLLNSLPIQTTNSGDFFMSIVFYNNTYYRNKCTECLYSVKK